MTYEICNRCGKMFSKNGKEYCEDCFEKIEKEYDLILEHIRKYPDATVLEIISETRVSLKTISCLVREGNFSYVKNKLEKIEDKENSYKILANKDFYIKRNDI